MATLIQICQKTTLLQSANNVLPPQPSPQINTQRLKKHGKSKQNVLYTIQDNVSMNEVFSTRVLSNKCLDCKMDVYVNLYTNCQSQSFHFPPLAWVKMCDLRFVDCANLLLHESKGQT